MKLGAVCSKIGSGATPRGGKEAYKGGATTLIRSQNIYNDGFHREGLAFIDDEQAAQLANVELQPDDVLLNITGDSVARCCQVASDVLPARVNQHVSIIRPHADKLDARFLRYVLASPAYQSLLLGLASAGATRNALTKGMIECLEVEAPNLPEQKAIARILGTLDDKIELNRRMNATLEAMARALFQSWFVDFDPVHAKAASPSGLSDEALAKLSMDPATAALFPTSFHDSALGEIPDGWTHAPIKDCCVQVQNGGTPRRNEPRFWDSGDIPWLASGEVRQAIVTITESFITDEGLAESSAKWVPAFSTVVALYGATAGQVSFTAHRLTTNQAVCALIPKENFSFFNYLTMRRATAELEKKAVGSAQQNISKGIVEGIEVVVPPAALVDRFTVLVNPLFEHWISNLHQSRTLATLRDALLPKLLTVGVSAQRDRRRSLFPKTKSDLKRNP